MRFTIFILATFIVASTGFSAIAGTSKIVRSAEYKEKWPFKFNDGTLHCKNIGNGRIAVWINASDDHTYAINGQAMSWFAKAGIEHRVARDHTDLDLSAIIQEGLSVQR